MGSPSLPPAPDYKAAAQATASGNQNASIAAQIGNMTNQAGPAQYALNEKGQMLDAAGNVVTDASKAQQLGSTGVNYTNPEKPDQFGNMPFDQSTLTPAQKATYASTGVLPKSFNVTYLPQQWTQSQVLGGNDQALYNQSLAAQLGLSEMALTGLDKVRGAIGENVAPTIQIQGGPEATAGEMTKNVTAPDFVGGGLNTSGLQDWIAPTGPIQNNIAPAGGQMQFATGATGIAGTTTGANERANAITGATGQASTSVDNNGQLIKFDSGANQQAGALSSNNAGQIKTSLGIDPQLLNQQTQDALYKANTQYLDPQFQQTQSQLENKLANQGITRGSEAYNNAMLNFNNQKQQAYESARNTAIGQSMAAAQGMFGMGLQGAQFGNQALAQQFGQQLSAQKLANEAAKQNNTAAQTNLQLNNAAVGQQFGQGLQTAQFGNQATEQNNATALANAQFANSAAGQNNALDLANAQFGNAAIAQNNANAANNAGFANAAQNQSFTQNQNAGNFANSAQAQQYGQNLSNQQATNAAVNQRFGMDTANQASTNNAQAQQYSADVANANMQNQQLSQLYNQQLQSGQMGNAASNQQLAQNQAIQQNTLNILQALRTGSQLNTANLPAVGVSQPGQLANWSGPDFLGAATAQGQYDQSIYNAKSVANSGLTSSLIGAGGALFGAGIKKWG